MLPRFVLPVALLGYPALSVASSAKDLIESALEALGGREALAKLSGVTYEHPEFVHPCTHQVKILTGQLQYATYQYSEAEL